jgi:hypothetical protein
MRPSCQREDLGAMRFLAAHGEGFTADAAEPKSLVVVSW